MAPAVSAELIRPQPYRFLHLGTSSSVATYHATSFIWKSSGLREVKWDSTILAIRTLCSTSFSHSTLGRPSLCVGTHFAVRMARTRLEAMSRAGPSF